MENLGLDRDFWKNKNVFVTGHTGFKGSWLSLWLNQMGANVYGYALEPETEISLYKNLYAHNIYARSNLNDIRNSKQLLDALNESQAEIVFHLAAQSLVRRSYENPKDTYEINLLGTINLFEAIRNLSTVSTIINITTDKCYDNTESTWPYREIDTLGGIDPYSNSKSCVELCTQCYRKSFFNKQGVYIANARAGNVIGGGDWSKDRLIPDFFKSLNDNQSISLRSPNSIRPWQHVLEPIYGYMLLAQSLYKDGKAFSGAWNFGPDSDHSKSVLWVINKLKELNPKALIKFDENEGPYESKVLKLDSSKAKEKLKWKPRWNISRALEETSAWYNYNNNIIDISINQINSYLNHDYK